MKNIQKTIENCKHRKIIHGIKYCSSINLKCLSSRGVIKSFEVKVPYLDKVVIYECKEKE